jgi:hypothetical protein
MKKRLGSVLIVSLVALLAGCGSGNNNTAKTSTSTSTTSASGAAKLERGVRSALAENRRLSVYVLWNNKIPSWAEHSTRGPALGSLRAAAQNRRKRAVRARMLEDRRQILSIHIDPSYLRATAIVFDRQRVQPSRLNGRPLGQAVRLNERARYELRRVGRSNRFVVWKVVVLR